VFALLAWPDEENDLIVVDYFAMLVDDIAARAYSKTEHRRALLPLLNNRSEGSVEFKHQNISAVLKGLGEAWIPGYKPAFNFQMALVDAVARWLALNPVWLGPKPGRGVLGGMREAAQIRRPEWCLFRLWNFSREPKAFELQPPLDAHVSLTATHF
jgi:hypothetical protein